MKTKLDSKVMRGAFVLIACLVLASCASSVPSTTTTKKPSTTSGKSPAVSGGGYYSDDGPPIDQNVAINDIPDATPRHESLSRTGNKPYEALGNKYYPIKSSKGFEQTGTASWYGKKYHGRRTSSGEPYDMMKMTAAHPVLPLPTYVEVTNLANNKKVIVKVNDRGPFLNNRVIDLSYVAALKLDIVKNGVGRVFVRALDPGDYASAESADVANIVNTTSDDRQSGAKYIIQVGAYADESNADALRLQLTDLGYSPYYPANKDSSNNLSRVLIGSYASYDAALNAKNEIDNLLNISTLLITKPND